MKKIAIGVACAAALLPFAAPAQAEPGAAGPTVTYSYVGPATAPEHHTEYVIEVRSGVATAKVGGYGTVDGTAKPARTQTTKLDYPARKALVQTAPSIPLSATGTPCPGASTHRLSYTIGRSAPRTAVAYSCALGNAGDVAAIKAYIAPVEKRLDVLPRVTFTVTG